MAALGMGGGRTVRAWAPAGGDAEPLALEAVRLAVELGVDVNASDAGGQTALDAALALEYETVIDFLVGHRSGFEQSQLTLACYLGQSQL